MSIRWPARAVCVLTFAMTLSACVTLPANAPRSKQDPWESWNRGVYRFNDSLDRHIAKPVAKSYVKVVPHPIRTGVSNFFANLKMTTVMVNDALQGKFKKAANDLGRLVLNTTVGIGGILDPATPAGLDKNDNDFGLTLGVWGLHPGPFVELPILGPSDVRDTFGKAVDTYTDPRQYVKNTTVRYVSYVPYYIDRRAALLPLDETLRNAFDPYAVMNESSPHPSPAPAGAGPGAAPSAPQPGTPPAEPSQTPAPAQRPPEKGSSPTTEPPEEPPL
jgi:phospholipid-binding lipoprotein MlaA